MYIIFELVVRSWFTLIGGQTVPPFFLEMENLEKALSIFVDESGDFGAYDSRTPYYIVSIILHDQSKNIQDCVSKLNSKIKSLGYESDFVIHTAPLIRRESVFSQDPPNRRRSLFSSLFFFTQRAPIQYKTFVFEKKREDDTFALEGRIAKKISLFLRTNLSFFQSFEEVILYYDNGQHELNRILNSVFSAELSSYSYRKVLPKDYKLFQSVDLICTLKLLELKCKLGKLSRSEELMFHSIRDLRKQFIKPIERKKFFP